MRIAVLALALVLAAVAVGVARADPRRFRDDLIVYRSPGYLQRIGTNGGVAHVASIEPQLSQDAFTGNEWAVFWCAKKMIKWLPLTTGNQTAQTFVVTGTEYQCANIAAATNRIYWSSGEKYVYTAQVNLPRIVQPMNADPLPDASTWMRLAAFDDYVIGMVTPRDSISSYSIVRVGVTSQKIEYIYTHRDAGAGFQFISLPATREVFWQLYDKWCRVSIDKLNVSKDACWTPNPNWDLGWGMTASNSSLYMKFGRQGTSVDIVYAIDLKTWEFEQNTPQIGGDDWDGIAATYPTK